MRAPKGEHHDCSERVYHSSRSFHASRCTKPALWLRDVPRREFPAPLKVYNEETFAFEEIKQEPRNVVDQKWFCGTHDPVAIKAREDKKDEARRARWAMEKRAREMNDDKAKLFAQIRAAKDAVVLAAARVVKVDPCACESAMREELKSLRSAIEALEAIKP